MTLSIYPVIWAEDKSPPWRILALVAIIPWYLVVGLPAIAVLGIPAIIATMVKDYLDEESRVK